MKKVILFLIILLLPVFGVNAQAAERLASFDVSSASSAAGTGFSFGVMPDHGGARIASEDDDTSSLCLYNNEEAAANDVVVAYDTSWSGTDVDHLVLKTRVKTDEISDSSVQKFISFRMKAAPHAMVFQIKGDQFYCNNTLVPGLKAEAGRWYDVQVALRQNPEPSIVLYIDGVKVATVPFPNLSKITSEGLQFRMEINGPGTFYIGDTSLYIPDKPVAIAENGQLSSADEPVILGFGDSEIDADTLLAKNISVTDNISGDTVDFALEQLDNNRIQLVFPEGLRNDNSYTINFHDMLDISGQRLDSIVFKTPVPENPYEIGDIKYYAGFSTETEITALRQGNLTVYADVKNGGLQERPLALVCVLYQDNQLSDISIAETTLAAEEETALTVSIHAAEVNSKTKLYTMFWRGFGGSPVTDAEILTWQEGK